MTCFKNILFIGLAILLISCSVQDDVVIPSNTNDKIQRVIDLAKQEAALHKSGARAQNYQLEELDLKTVVNTNSRANSDTIMYVVNFKNNEGFVIISAKNYDDPIIAVVPQGYYNPDAETDNPGFNQYMESVRLKLNNDSIGKMEPTIDEYQMTADGQYVKTTKQVINRSYAGIWFGEDFKWEQLSIYGKYCPNSIVGCGPLAVASIITFFKKEGGIRETFYYTYEDADVDSDWINWEYLFKHKNKTDCNNGSNCAESDKEVVHKQIARVCRQIGEECHANYRDFYTGVGLVSDLKDCLEKYLKSLDVKVSDEQPFSKAITSNEAWSAVYLMAAPKTKNHAAHIWVCDGSYVVTTEYNEYRSDPPSPNGTYHWKLYRTYTKDHIKNYMHWGWNGQHDGWYNYMYVDPFDDNDPYTRISYLRVGPEF